ncbi:hypothetical protein R1sor_006370 [Riccia sorocarpa]|uniref:Uncharacterized protein n=1 Tax=Riccia sorocarpa TaxID=122646 RepID=A0ABD3HTP0_9MARC
MGNQSRRQRTVDRKQQQAERSAASTSEHVASGSQRGIRRKVMEIVDKVKSLSCESVEYESKILTRFLKHSGISKALKRVLKRQNHDVHTLDTTQTEFYEYFKLTNGMVK